MQLSPQAFGSPELMQSLARMDANLQSLRPGEDWGGSRAVRRRAGARPRRRHRRAAGPRRPRRAGRPARPVLPRRADGRRRPRQAGPAARRRAPRSTRAPCRSSSGRCATAARCGAAPTASCRLTPKAMRQLGKALLRDVAQTDVRPPGPARPAPGRRGGRAVRLHPASGRSATPSRGTSRARSLNGVTPARPPRAAARCVQRRGHRGRPRPRRAPRRRSRCWSTRRSRWRWTAAGCR